MSLRMETAAFADGGPIPARHTCDGQDLSPALHWTGAPDGVRSFALLCDDPDAPAGTWVHWVLYDLPADCRDLAEGVPVLAELPDGTRQGRNDFKRVGYGGPCPPRGTPHRYFFRLYAVDSLLRLRAGARKADVLSAMKGHVLAETVLMGTYRR